MEDDRNTPWNIITLSDYAYPSPPSMLGLIGWIIMKIEPNIPSLLLKNFVQCLSSQKVTGYLINVQGTGRGGRKSSDLLSWVTLDVSSALFQQLRNWNRFLFSKEDRLKRLQLLKGDLTLSSLWRVRIECRHFVFIIQRSESQASFGKTTTGRVPVSRESCQTSK